MSKDLKETKTIMVLMNYWDVSIKESKGNIIIEPREGSDAKCYELKKGYV